MQPLHHFLGKLWQIVTQSKPVGEPHPDLPAPSRDWQPQQKPRPTLQPPKRSLDSYLQGYGTLPLRDRALVSLRTAHIRQQRHQIDQFTLYAIGSGMRNSDLQMIASWPAAPGFCLRDKILLRTTDELHKKQRITPPNWRALGRFYTSTQLIDLVFCIAACHL